MLIRNNKPSSWTQISSAPAKPSREDVTFVDRQDKPLGESAAFTEISVKAPPIKENRAAPESIKNLPTSPAASKAEPAASRKRSRKRHGGKIAAYLFSRRFHIAAFAVIYVAGLFIGMMVWNRLGSAEKLELQNTAFDYNSAVTGAEVTVRLFFSASLSAVLMFAIFLSGLTVFAPVVSALVCIFKGIMCAYTAGIYMYGSLGVSGYASAAAVLTFGALVSLFFIIASAEALSFSLFMLKNEESYRSSLSFKNITLYSSRQLLLFLCALIMSAAEVLVVPLILAAG